MTVRTYLWLEFGLGISCFPGECTQSEAKKKTKTTVLTEYIISCLGGLM